MTWTTDDRGNAIWDDNGKRIATVTSGNKDDARLLAAAPELLAALKSWEELRFQIVDALKRVEGTDGLRGYIHDTFDASYTALNKARKP